MDDLHHALLHDALDRFAGVAILVVGDESIDHYERVKHKFNPESDATCVEVLSDWSQPGMSGAVCQMIDGLGGVSLFDSSPAHKIPSLKVRQLIGERLLHRTDHDDATPLLTDREPAFLAAQRKLLDQAAGLLLCDYGKGTLTDTVCRDLIAAAKSSDIPSLVDPARGVGWLRYAGATIIKPNRLEWQEIASTDAQARTYADSVLVTLGHEGMLWFPDRHTDHLVNFPAEPAAGDVCGCGDLAAAVLSLTLAAGVSVPIGCQLANLACRLKLRKIGAVPVTAAELHAAIGK